eukprot:Sdes_comp18985_c0_seq2m9520
MKNLRLNCEKIYAKYSSDLSSENFAASLKFENSKSMKQSLDARFEKKFRLCPSCERNQQLKMMQRNEIDFPEDRVAVRSWDGWIWGMLKFLKRNRKKDVFEEQLEIFLDNLERKYFLCEWCEVNLKKELKLQDNFLRMKYIGVKRFEKDLKKCGDFNGLFHFQKEGENQSKKR